MRIKRLAVAAIAGLALMAAMVAGPLATVAAAKKPITVGVGPDPLLHDAESEAGEKLEPYVLFELKGAVANRQYRIVVEDAPDSKPELPCNPGLYTQWYRASNSGDVAFPLEPVASGTYLPFAGGQPCKGGYEMEVQERRANRPAKAVRAFAFSYPSFRFSYIPLH